MRKTVFIFALPALIVALAAWQKNPATKKCIVKGSVLETHSYCGGAVPSQDLLDRLAKPAPAPGMKLFVKKGAANNPHAAVIDTITADNTGNFSIHLAPGTYSILEKWKTLPLKMPKDDQWNTWDTACYRKNYLSPDYLLKVSGNTDTVKIIFNRSCSWSKPCDSYHGPLPPAAAPPPHRPGADLPRE